MKENAFKTIFAVVLAMFVSNVSAQGFLKKISKGLDKAESAMKKVDKVASSLLDTAAVDTTKHAPPMALCTISVVSLNDSTDSMRDSRSAFMLQLISKDLSLSASIDFTSVSTLFMKFIDV